MDLPQPELKRIDAKENTAVAEEDKSYVLMLTLLSLLSTYLTQV